MLYDRTCVACGKAFSTTLYNKITCCDECCKAYGNASRRRTPTKTKKTCPACGKEFTQEGHYQVYCSKECKDTAYHIKDLRENPRIKVCPICGKEFTSQRSAVYCSAPCRKEAKRKMNAEYQRKMARKKPSQEKTCPVCQKVFTTTNSKKIFCTPACAKLSTKAKEETHICPICGKAYQTIRKKKIYCSIDCADKAMKERKQNLSPTVKRVCKYCGEEFETSRSNCRPHCYKPECKVKRKEYLKELKEKRLNLAFKHPVLTDTLRTYLDAHEETGISYGQWQAQRYLAEHPMRGDNTQ